MNTAKYNWPFFDAMYERVKDIFEYIDLHYNGDNIVLIIGFTWKKFFLCSLSVYTLMLVNIEELHQHFIELRNKMNLLV